MVTVDAGVFPVDPTNAGQASEWDGADGEYWAKYHQVYERMLGVFDEPLLEAAAIASHDRCLDIGCGTGATTRALAARAAQGSVLGVDLSGPMLEIARAAARRTGRHNVEFVQGDAQVHPFEAASFDVAVSRMGSMFFGDPASAFANIGRALRPGGRIALAVWQDPSENRWITAIDAVLGEEPSNAPDEPAGYAPGPFSLADPSLGRSLLEQAGFVDINVEAMRIPLAFGTVDEAQAFLETWIDDDLDDEGRVRTAASLRRLLVDNVDSNVESDADGGVLLESATWILTARRPAGGN